MISFRNLYLALPLILCLSNQSPIVSAFTNSNIQSPLVSMVKKSRFNDTPFRTPIHDQGRAVHSSSKLTRLYLTEKENKMLKESEERGSVLFAVLFALLLWMFTLPPEFRRAYPCISTQCVSNRVKCNNCVTLSEWTNGVIDYYVSGGGVQFDFSIDPDSPMKMK